MTPDGFSELFNGVVGDIDWQHIALINMKYRRGKFAVDY